MEEEIKKKEVLVYREHPMEFGIIPNLGIEIERMPSALGAL
jgi:hypothetical protein